MWSGQPMELGRRNGEQGDHGGQQDVFVSFPEYLKEEAINESDNKSEEDHHSCEAGSPVHDCHDQF